jgi:hypothetical protein
MLVVRRPVKVVGREHEQDPLPLRLAIGVLVALGVAAVVWLIGYVGFRLGFAPLVRVPHLAGRPEAGLATGVMALIRVPSVILEAGLARTELMMLSFVLIAIPAGGLAAARPVAPGGPRPSSPALVFSIAGAAAAALVSMAMIWWTASSFRNDMLRELPFIAAQHEQWLRDLRIVAGLDVLALVASSVWAVLVMRLAIPRWLRAIVGAASFLALAVVFVATSVSNASHARMNAPRSVFFAGDGSLDTRLLIGSTEHQVATLHVADNGVTVELIDTPAGMTVIGRQSIAEFLARGDRGTAAADR